MKMEKNKTIASILVIIGALAITSGILINNFGPKDEPKDSGNDHFPEKVEFCDTINHEEKATFVLTQYISETEEKELDYTFVKSIEDFYAVSMEFEYNEENFTLDFDNYDYLIYFLNDGKRCAKSRYLSNYKLDGNNLTIELTKSELNTEECKNGVIYGYGIALEKDKVNPEALKIDVITKEDPFKECYK